MTYQVLTRMLHDTRQMKYQELKTVTMRARDFVESAKHGFGFNIRILDFYSMSEHPTR
jgi:hypothetical protein